LHQIQTLQLVLLLESLDRLLHGMSLRIYTVRPNLAEGGEAVHAERWVKATAEDDKVECIRFYKQDFDIGNIQTSERKIYGAGPGEQVYLLLIKYAKPSESISDLFQR
jgi:hypothetical protein